MDYDLGYFELETRVLEPLDPTSSKRSPDRRGKGNPYGLGNVLTRRRANSRSENVSLPPFFPRPLNRCPPLFCQFLLLELKREKPMGPGKVAIHPEIPQPHVLDCLYHPTVRPPNAALGASAPAESATGAQRELDRSDTQKGFDWNCPIS
jgi:hypothetical protein